MGLFNLFKPAHPVLVVDAVSLNESLGMKGNIPPRNQLQTLRRLARFAQREKIVVVAVLTGSPLHKAPGGEKFEDITVIYSKSDDDHAVFLAKTIKARGAGAVLVTGNAAVEKTVGSSVKKLRMSTFRKVFDIGGDPEAPERNANPVRANNGNRPPRKNRPKPSNEPRQERQERPAREPTEADAINELIDLVD